MLRLKGMSARNEPRCRLCRRVAPMSSFSWTPTRSVYHRLYRPMACIDLFLRSRTHLCREKPSMRAFKLDTSQIFFFFSLKVVSPQRDAEVTVGPTVGIVVRYLDTHVYIWLCSVGWNIVGRSRTKKCIEFLCSFDSQRDVVNEAKTRSLPVDSSVNVWIDRGQGRNCMYRKGW